jgi:hypothetical protein
MLREPLALGGLFLSNINATFSVPPPPINTTTTTAEETTWTIVDAANPNSTAVFTGGAFALRADGKQPPFVRLVF